MNVDASQCLATAHASGVLFLDVDGVLNQCGTFHDIQGEKVALLHQIVAETRCSIVVSSTWRRTERTRKLLTGLLQEGGVSIADWTPCLDRISDTGLLQIAERGHEIQAWLDAHPEITRFVILDDSSDMAHLMEHLVQTDTFTGLTETQVQEVIRRLK
jgi:hypothetical protein